MIKKNDWYFTVSSKSYFTPIKKGKISVTLAQFNSTEESFEKYTQKLLSLKLYYTKNTQKNLELKNDQEEIIKKLKDDIIDNVFNNITKLNKNKNELEKKMKECEDKQKEIDKIKNEIKFEDQNKKEI